MQTGEKGILAIIEKREMTENMQRKHMDKQGIADIIDIIAGIQKL